MIFTRENFLLQIALFIGIAITPYANAAAQDPPMRELLARCAPTVAESTMASIVKVESSGNAFAVADAGPVNLPWNVRKHMVRSFFPGTKEEAVELVHSLLRKGHTVSMGLSQVNDRNLKRLGLSVEQMFDPCKNLAAGGQILTNFYQRARRQFGPGDRALRAAISAYNSGDWDRGEANGYVGSVYKAAGIVPPLKAGKSSNSRAPAGSTPTAVAWWSARAELLKQARESDLTDSVVE